METHWEKRIAALEQELREACAAAQGYRLALEETQRQIAELSLLHVCGPAILKSHSSSSAGERDLEVEPKRKKNRG